MTSLKDFYLSLLATLRDFKEVKFNPNYKIIEWVIWKEKNYISDYKPIDTINPNLLAQKSNEVRDD